VSFRSFGTPLSSLPPKKKKKEKEKNKGVGASFVFDTLSITPVVSGPPFCGMVCLQECRDDVVDCSSEAPQVN
jgi:hypothetical protein